MDMTDGKHRRLTEYESQWHNMPDESKDWKWLHRAKVKPTDIDAIVKSRKGRLLVIEFKVTTRGEIYSNYHQHLTLKAFVDKGIEAWMCVEDVGTGVWYFLDFGKDPRVGKVETDHTKRSRVHYDKSQFEMMSEQDLIDLVEGWYALG